MGANWGLLNGINMGLREGIDSFISERNRRDDRLERSKNREEDRADKNLDRTERQKQNALDAAFRRLEARKSGYNFDTEALNFDETPELQAKKAREAAVFDPNSEYSKVERDTARGLLGGTKYKGLIRDDMQVDQVRRTLDDVNPYLTRESSERQAQSRLNKEFGNPNKMAFDRLPRENQEQISKIATSSAGKKAIANAIKADLKLLNDPSMNDEQKLVHARSMIKTLNSQQGQDAVGAEESKRLAALLEFNLVNLQQPGPKGVWPFGAGRAPISDFVNQAQNISDTLDRAVELNNKETDALYGRSGGMAGGGKPTGLDPQQVAAYAKRYGLDEAHAEQILMQRTGGGGASGVAGR